MKILLIIPAYNEEASIKRVYDTINKYNKTAKQKYDVLIINDGSYDRTQEILEQNQIPHIRLLQNLGIGGAVQTGYKYALENDYDIAVQFDGDGQHDVNYVENICKPIIKKEADMVIGSRFVDKRKNGFQSSKMRRLGISIISKSIWWKTKKKIYDTTSGFRAVNKKVIAEFAINYPSEYPEPISTVNILSKKYQVKEIPVKMLERQSGTSSIGNIKSCYYMINVTLSIILSKGCDLDEH